MLQQFFTVSPSEISIVIPVKNNQRGIDDYLKQFFSVTPSHYLPAEIIIVDNNSDTITTVQETFPIPIKVTVCTKRGPAAARNQGVNLSVGTWIVFHDSDTMVEPWSVAAYCCANYRYGCVAMQGRYVAAGEGHYAQYYAKYMSANPLPILDVNTLHKNPEDWEPHVLVTANCMVNKQVFEQIGGFDEQIVAVASEDVELGIRLKQMGHIKIQERSVVTHHMTESLGDFCDRWIRYARGDQYVSLKHPNRERYCLPFPDDMLNSEGVELSLRALRHITGRLGALMGPPE